MATEKNENDKSMLMEVLRSRKRDILKAWTGRIHSTLEKEALEKLGEHYIATQVEILLEHCMEAFPRSGDEHLDREGLSDLVSLLEELSSFQAKEGIAPSQTALLIFSLKDALSPFLQEVFENDIRSFNEEFLRLNRFVDRLGLLTFESFSKAREEIIIHQSQAIMDLSTPIITLWDRILLLPLIGVVDTKRAVQVIEELLEGIFRTESYVAILDVTGVPIIDTRVAHHLIKTISAVQMLGAEVIITGISPDMAQTLVKLNINFGLVETCGTLQSGVMRAFALLGKRIVDTEPRKMADYYLRHRLAKKGSAEGGSGSVFNDQ